jgi:N-methylhydantoinase A/oxoprolinase/acetone carboxylase beta subunit
MRFALNGRDESELACQLTLRRAIVALGAPVGAYMPAVASKLNTELVIPQWSEVANAVGAVAGSVTQRATVVIQPIDRGELYRVYLPDGYHDFNELEAAVAEAQTTMLPLVSELARAAGANHIEAHLTRRDDYAPIAGSDDRIYLGTELRFIASGRPTVAEAASATPERRA